MKFELLCFSSQPASLLIPALGACLRITRISKGEKKIIWTLRGPFPRDAQIPTSPPSMVVVNPHFTIEPPSPGDEYTEIAF